MRPKGSIRCGASSAKGSFRSSSIRARHPTSVSTRFISPTCSAIRLKRRSRRRIWFSPASCTAIRVSTSSCARRRLRRGIVRTLAARRDNEAARNSEPVARADRGRAEVLCRQHRSLADVSGYRHQDDRRDRILLGSDWPFPMGAPSAEHDLGHLDEKLRRRIRKFNAEEAFGDRLKSQQGVS